MSVTRRIHPVLVCAMFMLALALLSQVMFAAVTTNAHPSMRVTDRVDNSKRTVVRGHVPRVITRSTDLGRLSGGTPMRHMMLVLKPSAEQEHELQTLIDQQHDKRTANHHQWLTPEEFGDKFGVHDSDIAQVKTWLASQGLEVESVGKNKRIIQFSGKSGQVENAFQTELHYFRTPKGETHISANSDIYVPAALHSVIAGLHGTNDFFKKPHMRGNRKVKLNTAKSKIKTTNRKWTFGSLTSLNTIVGPNDFATIYNTLPLLNTGINGAGIKIGVIGQSDILMSDVQAYRNMFNLPVNNPNFISPGEDAGVSPGDDSESDLDVEIAGGVAPGATVDFVPGASTLTIAGVDVSLMYMVENNTDDIITSSYGGCEAEDTAGELAFYLAMSEQGAAQGQTLMVASGDSGPSECDDSSANNETHGYAVGDNDGNAYVLSIGGTQFNEGGFNSGSGNYAGTTTFWVPSNSNGLSTAVSYIPEEPWNEAAGTTWPDAGEIWASNGGVGSAFQTPAFQTNGSGAIPGLPTPGQGDPFIGNKIGSFTISGTNTGYTSAPTVTITGGGCTTQYYCQFINGIATATVSGGKVTAFTITNPGEGYVTAPTVTLSTPGCGANCATVTANIVSNADPATPIIPGPHRYQPDVSFNAAVGHDPTAYCAEGICQIDSNGNPLGVGVVGGTSVAAPSYAGVQALVDQYNGGRQGMPGYILYALAAKQATTPGWAACNSNPNSPSTLPASTCVFNDVTVGNTNICSVAATGGGAGVNCRTATSVIGWPATTGYDYGTGLGSTNVYNLATQWSSATFNSSATAMSLTASGITHGTAAPVTVNVTGSAGVATGDVAFTLSGGSLTDPINTTTGALQNPAAFGTLSGGTYTGSISNLPGGSYNVFARYGGDANYGSSTSVQVPVTVLPENSSINLATSSVSNSGVITPATTFVYGQFVWVDANPAGGSGFGVPTGTVTISDNGTPIATLNVNPTGQAFLAAGNIPTASAINLFVYQNINAFHGGPHSLTASYSGDSSFNSSTAGPLAFIVNPLSVTPTLASGETLITSGFPTTLTATFATPSGFTPGGNSGNNRSPGLSGPTGTVTFTDTVNGVLGTAPAVPTATFSATATLTTTGITTSGAHSITASYSGDSNYVPTSSAPLATITVGTNTATTTVVTSSGNPTTLGGRPTFTATISGGSSTPTTGAVTFYDGGTFLGAGSTVGTAHTSTFRIGNTQAFTGGAHNITAAFGGVTTTAAASVSANFVETVTAGTTTTQLTAQNGANVGQTVTFSALVTPSSTSATYAPSAGVQFYIDSIAVGSPVPLYFISANNDGYALYEAQFSTSFASAGTHVVTSTYLGDVNYPTPSSSNAQSVIISGASASAVLYFPAPTSTLPGNSTNFKWLPGASATKYWIDAGSTAGGNNYYQSGPLTTNNLGAVVNDLPIDGSTVYVTLYSFISGSWVSTPYTYTAFGVASEKAMLTFPTPNGSTLGGSSVTFTWSAGSGASNYWIDVGSTVGGSQYTQSGQLSSSTFSKTVSTLPTDASQVYVTLYSKVNGVWLSQAYNFIAFNGGSCLGTMASPLPGTLSGNTVTFNWTANCGGESYWLDVGSLSSENMYYQSGNLGGATTTTVTTLPADGSTINVTLWTLVSGSWSNNVYTYTSNP